MTRLIFSIGCLTIINLCVYADPRDPYWQVLKKFKSCGFNPSQTIDIGANGGSWARDFHTIYPNSKIFMIEGNSNHADRLKSTGFPFEIALLSNHHKNVTFYEGPGAGTGSTIFKENTDIPMIARTVSTTTVDEVLAKHQVEPAAFIKLDIQGSEYFALRGANKALAHAEVIITEAPLMNYNEGSPSFLSLYNFLDRKGFALFAISDVTQPSRGFAIQFDPTFVRKTSKLWGTECTGYPVPSYFNSSIMEISHHDRT